MNGISTTPPSNSQPMSREVLLTLLDSALRTDEIRYARRLCTAWLAIYPGDLEVSLLNARAFNKDSSDSTRLHALPILEEICKLDPEYLEAQELLAEIRQLAGQTNHLVAKACANALSHGHAVKTGKNGRESSWAKYVHEARLALYRVKTGDYQQIEKAEHFIHKALIENPDTPLAAVIHLRLMESKGSMPKLAIRNLAQIYHERWPDCLQFTLSLANEFMESGESTQAVDMLHQAVSKDTTGQVAKRIWGDNHPYTTLWPSTIEASNSSLNSPQNIPIPAAVASSLGWNQLVAGVPESVENNSSESRSSSNQSQNDLIGMHYKTPAYVAYDSSNSFTAQGLSEPTQSAQSELTQMANSLQRPLLAREDGRFPIYVVFSTQAGLESLYGAPAVDQIDKELKKLVRVIHGHKINKEFWGSLLFYADDESSTRPFNLKPTQYNDAWQLKLILADLDNALGKRGERIGAVLIVGGPEVVPFHNLPNPVEDADADVASDNPYAAKDSNYFISDWLVGRISAGTSTDPGALIKIIQDIANRYDSQAAKPAWYYRLVDYIRQILRRGLIKRLSSYGYTAAVWQRASQSVFQSIGSQGDLLVSPPTHSRDLFETGSLSQTVPAVGTADQFILQLPEAELGYFNLHGVPDASEWYGQSDPTLPETGPDFPIAMRPQDISTDKSAPRLVFSEACYGANIAGKSVDEAIALKFLVSGTHAVIGSTCISYGSLANPLSSADLLGRVFWNLLLEGFTAGESLRRAKIHLTREMNQRQGFLDAEDQKTLISFVLYGDPLALPYNARSNPKNKSHLSGAAVTVPTVCEHANASEVDVSASLETIPHLKGFVAQYLPGMSDATVCLTEERQTCANLCGNCGSGKKCALSQLNSKDLPAIKLNRKVVTLSKSYTGTQHTHRQFARLTLDEGGKIVKMVVSH